MDNIDGALDTPLHQLPAFGRGLHRRPVQFVREGELDVANKKTPAGSDAQDAYLSIVLGKKTKTNETKETDTTNDKHCDTCHLQIPTTNDHHAASLVHQVSVPHHAPPSALDRSRFGLQHLQMLGWDPDARRGLGAQEQGVTHPVRTTQRPTGAGLGVDIEKMARKKEEQPKKSKGDAKTMRRRAKEEKRRNEKLREQIMFNKDLEKYLG